MQTSGAHPQKWFSWSGAGVRSRLRRNGRFGWLFLQIVPWLNAIVIAALAAALSGRVVVNKSVNFSLPSAPFEEGSQSGAGLVLFQTDDQKTLAFFDDVRYIIGSDDDALKRELARYARQRKESQILLLADEDIRHGEVMHVVNLVRDAGVRRVNVALKPQ
jgi:biopolymer transport protein ExbD